MPEFVLYSRKGRTVGKFKELRTAGRLDLVYQCILMGMFTSHGKRKDTLFHVILGGAPQPPVHIRIDGAELHDVRTDEATWSRILSNVLSGEAHPGITVQKGSFQSVIKGLEGRRIWVLEERGVHVGDAELSRDDVFVLGDQVGLPKKDESFALRYGEKLSLGRKRYLAAACVSNVHFVLDQL